MGGIGKFDARHADRGPGRQAAVGPGPQRPARGAFGGSFAAGSADADFIICDDFDDNLSHDAGQWCVRDPSSRRAHPLDRQAADHQRTAVHVNPGTRRPSRRPGTCAAGRPRTDRHHQARLSPARATDPLRAGELTGALPRSGSSTTPTGPDLAAHGRSSARIEYLDSLLAAGERFLRSPPGSSDDPARTGQPLPRTEPTELPEATAEAIADTAGDQLFGELYDRLSAGSRTLLVRTSVFRPPIRLTPWGKPGQLPNASWPACCQLRPGSSAVCVPLDRRPAASPPGRGSLGSQVVAPPAGGGLLARPAADTRCAGLEAVTTRASEPAPPPDVLAGGVPGSGRRRRVVRFCVAGAFAWCPRCWPSRPSMSGSHLASAETAAQTSARVPVSQAAASPRRRPGPPARSAGARLSPAIPRCVGAHQHGVPTGDLLVVGLGTSDRSAPNVVVARRPCAACSAVADHRVRPDVWPVSAPVGAHRYPRRRPEARPPTPAPSRGPAGPAVGRRAAHRRPQDRLTGPRTPSSRRARSTRGC